MVENMEERRILIFEEDQEMGMILKQQLEDLGFTIRVHHEIRSALAALKADPFSLILSGSRVSDLGILGWISEARSLRPGIPFLVLSDPPFSSEHVEVLYRPYDRTTLRSRIQGMFGSTVVFTIDEASEDVLIAGKRVDLTRSEFRLLKELYRNPKIVFSREDLIRSVQGEGITVVDRAIDAHIFSLRKKLGAQGALIETVRGEGYVFQHQGSQALRMK